MQQSSDSSTELKNFVRELVKCPICLDDLDAPTSLPCLHTFCLNCIRKHFKQQKQQQRRATAAESNSVVVVNCPCCKETYTAPRDEKILFKSNFYIKGLVDAQKVAGRPINNEPCEGCQTNRAFAVTYCIGCRMKLCKTCNEHHQRIPGESHQIHPFDHRLREEVLQTQSCYCSLHPSNKLEVFCAECKKCICLACNAIKHKTHEIKDLSEVYSAFKEILKTDVEAICKQENKFKANVKHLGDELTTFRTRSNGVREDLTAAGQTIDTKKNQVLDELTNKLDDVSAKAAKVIDAIKEKFAFNTAAAHSFTSYASHLVSSGKPSDVINEFESLHQRADKLLRVSSDIEPHRLPDLDVSVQMFFDKMSSAVVERSTEHKKTLDRLRISFNNERQKYEQQLSVMRSSCEMKDEVLKEKDLANSNLQVDNHQLNNVVISLRTKTEQQQKENEEIEKKSGEHERQISKLKEDKIQACRQINEMKTERTTMQILLVLLLAVLVGGFAVWFSHFHSSDTGKEVLQSVMDKLHTEHKQHLEKSKAGLAEVAASTGVQLKIVHALDSGSDVKLMSISNGILYVLYDYRGFFRFSTYLSSFNISTFSHLKSIDVPGIGTAKGIAVSGHSERTYVSDWNWNVIHVIDHNTGKTLQWPVDDKPDGVSVTASGQVLVTCPQAAMVKVLSSEGKLIREIKLQSGIVNPFHVVETNSNQFAVAHGWQSGSVHGVCLITANGTIQTSYEHTNLRKLDSSIQLKLPNRIQLNGFVFVYELWSRRIVMLTPNLKLVREFSLPFNPRMSPQIDDETQLLYVANGSRVEVYKFT